MQTVNHIAVNGIIYRASNPEEIFLDIKDQTYPHIVWRGCACLIGGNWTGKDAADDTSPLHTFCREVEEELSLKKSEQSTAGLDQFDVIIDPIRYRVSVSNQPATDIDALDLAFVKQTIQRNARFFDNYIVHVPREVFLRGDPNTKSTDFTALISVFEVPLDDGAWSVLTRLQRKFENLSCESETCLLSMEKMIAQNILAMSGQDQILQDFFEDKNVARGRMLPRDNAVTLERAKGFLLLDKTYSEYLRHYTVLRKPEGR